VGFSRYGIGEGAAAPSILGHEARDDELDEPVERAGLPLMASWRAEPGGSEGGTLRRRREPPAMAAEMGAAGGGNDVDGESGSGKGRIVGRRKAGGKGDAERSRRRRRRRWELPAGGMAATANWSATEGDVGGGGCEWTTAFVRFGPGRGIGLALTWQGRRGDNRAEVAAKTGSRGRGGVN